MVVGSSRNDLDASVHQSLAEGLCIIDNSLLVNLEIIAERLLEADCLRRDDVHQRAALNAGENCLVEIVLFIYRVAGKNHSSTGTAQRLVGRRGRNVRIGDGARMKTCCHKSRNVRHIYHQNSAHLISHLTELLEIDCPGICRCTGNNHLRL